MLQFMMLLVSINLNLFFWPKKKKGFINLWNLLININVAAHINHIKRVAGIDHVGLGAGFDGIN